MNVDSKREVHEKVHYRYFWLQLWQLVGYPAVEFPKCGHKMLVYTWFPYPDGLMRYGTKIRKSTFKTFKKNMSPTEMSLGVRFLCPQQSTWWLGTKGEISRSLHQQSRQDVCFAIHHQRGGGGVGSWSLRTGWYWNLELFLCYFLVGFRRPNVNRPKKDTTGIPQNSNLQCVGHDLPIFGTEMTVVFSCCVLRLNAMREDMEYRGIPESTGIG